MVSGDLAGVIWAALALALGGILKGATGAGAPIIAVPVIALFHDVPTAVVALVLPNCFSNLWQSWTYRKSIPEGAFAWAFAGAGLVGALAGTVMLASFTPQILLLMVAGVVFLYIAFRLARPGWRLPFETARRMVLPAGLAAGILQGATGVSAPVSITFLNAIGFERRVFIGTISIFFLAMTLIQIPLLIGYGMLTPHLALLSAAALLPILGGMPIGAALAQRIPREVFDKVILALIAVVAARLAWSALASF